MDFFKLFKKEKDFDIPKILGKEVSMAEESVVLSEKPLNPVVEVPKTAITSKIVSKPVTRTPDALKPDHKHEWELISKTYAMPRKEINLENQTMSEELVQKVLFGVTTLLWKCILCTETKKEEVLGTDENQLDEVFNRALQFGPQYIQREGITFVIGKWQQPQQNSIPVR